MRLMGGKNIFLDHTVEQSNVTVVMWLWDNEWKKVKIIFCTLGWGKDCRFGGKIPHPPTPHTP